MQKQLNVVLAGIGKIARDQHLPQLVERPDLNLTATVSRSASIEGYPAFTQLSDAIAAYPEIGAVVICTPPQARFSIAVQALKMQRHVLLEKPPCATLAEIRHLSRLAQQSGTTLFASWHSRYASGVEPARQWLADKTIEQVNIVWRENVREWHPGQDWIFDAGGLGVFDPGVNALSIMTHILPDTFSLNKSRLYFPANRDAPIAAELEFSTIAGSLLNAAFDFREVSGERWEIEVLTQAGTLILSAGGAQLTINGQNQNLAPSVEYAGLYERFINLVKHGDSDVDLSPFIHLADAFLLGEREDVGPFDW